MSGSERLNKLSSITLANVPTIMVDKEQQFHDHVNKCRCCFNEFVADNRKVEISEWHRKVFRSVIKVELRMDSNLSAYLCQNCDKKLKNTSEFVQVIEKMTDRCDQDEYTLKDNNISHDIIEDNENVLGVMGNIEIDKEQFSTHQIKFKLAFYCEIDMGLISKVNLKDCSVNLERLSENSSRKYMTEFELLFKKDSKIEKLLLYCDQCRYQTTRRQYIYNHIKRMHKQIEIFFNCDLCRYQTTIKPYIHNHMKRTHSFKESKCMKCDKVYANETKLRDNVMEKHRKIPKKVGKLPLLPSTSRIIFICDFCHYWTYKKATLKRHITSKHQKDKISCNICKNKYANEALLKLHLKKHLSEKPKFRCRICWADFTLYKYLSCHVEKCHLIEKKKIISSCDVCGMAFFLKSVLENHMSKFHGHPFKCFNQNCSRSFPRKDSRNSHYATFHRQDQKEIQRVKRQEENLRPYKCPFDACSLSFEREKTMRSHFKIHQKSAEEVRQEIHKRTKLFEERSKIKIKTLLSWNKSKKSSWMKQIFICDICDYTTPTKGTMINHMNMRHKFEASECHICKKFYVNAMKLKKHLRSHFENEKYECSLCARKFNTYTVLCSHIERHHKMKKTQITSLCDFCGEEYLSKVQLENHLIRFHSGAYGCFMTDCNRRFCSQTNRKLHYLLYHRFDQNQTELLRLQQAEEIDMRPYKCLNEACGKTFKTPDSRNKHNFQVHMMGKDLKAKLSSVIGSKKFKKAEVNCLLCDKKFNVYEPLCRHIQKHHFKDKSKITFGCDICGKDLFLKQRLEFHMRNDHTGPFKCFDESCRKSFTQNRSRRKHFFQYHNNDKEVYQQKEQEEGAAKPYKCPYDSCGKSFKRHDAMKSHYISAHSHSL